MYSTHMITGKQNCNNRKWKESGGEKRKKAKSNKIEIDEGYRD